jgi:transcription elongation factor Elf1
MPTKALPVPLGYTRRFFSTRREITMYPTIDEKQSECPICGHEALIIEDYGEKDRVVLCCDDMCPNWGGRYDQ